jgi:uncharacterized protein
MESNFVVIVFAKEPIPGQAKTRLIPALGAEQAALLHAALTERAIMTAQKTTAEDVELCCTPNSEAAFFQYCAEDFDVSLTDQGDGDLGARMLRALDSALEHIERVIIIGADCPALTAKHIQTAATALDNADVVLMPAEDGGYVLIGATRTDPKMFDNTHWGTASVLVEQRRNLATCGLTFVETDTLWDVDRPEDLPRVKALKPPLEFFWPE